jgi:hypothetical protein
MWVKPVVLNLHFKLFLVLLYKAWLFFEILFQSLCHFSTASLLNCLTSQLRHFSTASLLNCRFRVSVLKRLSSSASNFSQTFLASKIEVSSVDQWFDELQSSLKLPNQWPLHSPLVNPSSHPSTAHHKKLPKFTQILSKIEYQLNE